MKTHKNLEIWKQSIDFVILIYKITHSFPSKGKFGLTNQILKKNIHSQYNDKYGLYKLSYEGKLSNLAGVDESYDKPETIDLKAKPIYINLDEVIAKLF